jgi:hypothetical protein
MKLRDAIQDISANAAANAASTTIKAAIITSYGFNQTRGSSHPLSISGVIRKRKDP